MNTPGRPVVLVVAPSAANAVGRFLLSPGIPLPSVKQEIGRYLPRLVVYGVEQPVLSYGDAVSFQAALEFLAILGTGVILEGLDSFPNLSSVFWRETFEPLEYPASNVKLVHWNAYSVDARPDNSASTSATE